MSGVEVISTIAAVIGIIDACVKIYDSAAKDLNLSDTFRNVTRQLPIIAATLSTCKAYLEPKKDTIPSEIWKALEDTLDNCEERARNLRTIFEKVLTNDTDGWKKRYAKVVQRLGKGNQVEELMKAITEDVQLIVNHRMVQLSSPTGTPAAQRQKADFSYTKPIGLCLDQAPHIDSSLFIGRATEIHEMHQILRPDHGPEEQRRIVLGGMGGMGKTQLAIAYAKRKCKDYDSVLWINATSEATLKVSFRSLAERIFDVQHLHELTAEQVLVGVKQWLSEANNTNWLLIFDNYDEPNTYDLRSFYPHTSHGALVVTTRLPDEVGAEVLTIRSLSDIEESVEILQSRSKRENVKQDIHARRLAERMAGCPLALASAGVFLHKDKSTWTFQRYLLEYEKRWNIDPKSRLRLHEYQNRTLYTTWDLSHQRLHTEDPDAAQMLKLLAYFGNQSVWYELFHAGWGKNLPQWLQTATGDLFEFEALMRPLVDHCFLEVQSDTHEYVMHTCVHDWVLSGLNTTVESWSYWYAFECVVKSIGNEPLETFWHSRFTRYIPHAMRLTNTRFDLVFKRIEESQIDGVENIARLLQWQGQLPAARKMMQRALTWREETLGPDHGLTLSTITNLGFLYMDQYILDEAELLFIRALAGTERLFGRNDSLTLDAVKNLGRLYADQGKLDEALTMYERVLAWHETVPGQELTPTPSTLDNLGLLYADQGKLVEAQIVYQRALARNEKAFGCDHVFTLMTVNNLGNVYRNQGKLDAAGTMLQRALTGMELMLGREHQSTLSTVNNLGLLYVDQGKLVEAEEQFCRVLTNYQGTDIQSRWEKTIDRLATTLRMSIRATNHDLQATKYRFACLVRHTERWGKANPHSIECLARAFISLKHDDDAQTACLLVVKLNDNPPMDFNHLECDGCDCEITLATGRYVCRDCNDVDLCDLCMPAYTGGSLTVTGCQSHEFFDAGSAASSALKSPQHPSHIDFHVWIEKLKAQYPLPADNKEGIYKYY